MAPRRQGSLTAVVAAVGLGLIVTGCPNETDATEGDRVDVVGRSSTAAPATTSSTTTTTTTPPLTGAGLDACPDEPGLRSTTEWLPSSIPDGYELVAAWSTTPGPAAPSPTPSPAPALPPDGPGPYFTSHLLQLAPDGTILATVELQRAAFEVWSQSGYAELEEDPVLTKVRGHSGRISSWVNRGHSTPYRVATWREADGIWIATADVDAATLADWLSTLTLSGTEIVDRVGRLVEVGRRVDLGEVQLGGTAIELRRIGTAADAPEGSVSIGLSPRDAPSVGLDSYGLQPLGTIVRRVDGRWLAVNPSTVSAVLDDGSLAVIANAHITGLTSGQLTDLLLGLQRVPADDPRLDEVPVFRDHDVVAPSAVCRRTS